MVPRIWLYCLLVGWVFLAWGCLERDLTFQVRYDQVSGLREGDPVYFEGNEIGEVCLVSYRQKGDYLVEIKIASEFKNAATGDSSFYIDEIPGADAKKYLRVVQSKPGGMLVEQGVMVEGSVEPGLLQKMMSGLVGNGEQVESNLQEKLQQLKKSLQLKSQQMDIELEGALDALSSQLRTFNDELKKVPDREEVQKLEKTLDQVAQDLKKAQQGVRDSIRDELIPELRKELEQIRKRLQDVDRQDEMEPVEERAEQLNTI